MRNLIFIILIVLVLIGIVVFASGHTNQSISSQAQSFTFVVKHNQLVQGTNNPKVKQGDAVAFLITADKDGELHLHGYDKHVTFKRGIQAKLTFTANLVGHFTYELEDSKTEIGALDVLPK